MACIALWSAAGLGAAASVDLAIDDVTVIDPATREVLDHRSVYIAAGKVISVEPSPARKADEQDANSSVPTRASKSARPLADAASGPGYGKGTDKHHAVASVDGAGKFLIPGLWDMHSHLRDYVEYALPMHIAFGVTGIRDMSGDCSDPSADSAFCIDDVRRLSSRIATGEVIGPRVLWVSSDFVHGPELRSSFPAIPAYIYPATADDGRLVAEHWKARGVDFIKTYNGIPPVAYFALADRARELGIEVSGHVPLGVSVSEAAAHGHRTVEHARSILYDCSDYGPEYRAAMAAVASGVPNSKIPDSTERMRRTINEFDARRCEAVLADLAARGVYYTPTHLTRESDARASDVAYRNDPRLKYVIPKWRDYWESNLNSTASKSAEVRELYQRFHELGLRVTGLAQAKGVKILAGTDAFDTMIFPGASLHDELVLLHKAGLPPLEVLRTATTNAVEYLGLQRQYGAIHEGRMADLVLLNANPLEDIRNTRQIAAVIVGGRFLDRAQLDVFLRDAERYVEQAKAEY